MSTSSSIFILFFTIATLFTSNTEASSVDFVKKIVSSHSIVIFSKSYYPYCKRAKGVFKELNAKPYVLELDERGEWFWILLFALLVIALVLNNFLI
ncbi:putative thioredoxin-disulfide reductase [Helianthus annuus]|uniref:Putative thioredoxin-like fold protein n=1 Tax=Helianthus annuus TaxID=4232 RepID=A0A251UFZ4_HELAN|nr:putative thioredoxin-disulfide reductase [Helianthus annuus]KAJ0479045.1 putative thioredoxin-disulfide reductase [Helianthus annuus]KAJ0483927.1 putative thioredoxin-disulfide reductase [Helianthus annuus]KAJ0665883.1 putative thioredoxin-disulfide reductase [Helianthus annuus]KAJ0851663.1 putative thioredoxin-disulfide reductase [Helianthus annuus]